MYRRRLFDKNTGKQTDTGGSGELRTGLGRRKLKNAISTVFGNFGEYTSFFVALFIIQSLLWLVCLTTVTSTDRERVAICSEYDYHMEISQLTATDYANISNTLVIKDNQQIRSYESYEWIKPDSVQPYYTLRVLLKNGYDSDDESLFFYQRVIAAFSSVSDPETFIEYYLSGNGVDTGRVQIDYTPLYYHDAQTVSENTGNAVWLCLLLTAMSVALLTLLYGIRLNHYKFMYGIYMTCGADFRRLFKTSILEMMVIACTTLILSLGFSVGVCAALLGSMVHIRWWQIPLVLALNYITVRIAVWAPTKRLSSRPPIELIVAQDNSNLVTSPRRSFRIFNKTFPYHYELFSTWRFRRYFVRLLIGAVMFTSVFICGVFIAGLQRTNESVSDVEYIVHADLSDIDPFSDGVAEFNLDDVLELMGDAQREAICTVDGVDYTVWTDETSASSIVTLMLVSQNMYSSSKYTADIPSPTDEYRVATNFFAYQALDRHYIDTLCSLYSVDGDPYLVLEGENNIIVSDSVYGESSFGFKPGDTVRLGTKVSGKLSETDYLQLNDREILSRMLQKMTFVYEEYNVVAVVHGLEAEKGFVVGMSWDRYLRFTGKTSMSGDIAVFVVNGVPASASETILRNIRMGLNDYLSDYGIDYMVSNHYSMLNRELAAQRHSYARTLIIALLLLALSPVVWLFSQLLFYFKREKEMAVLRMFGAGEGQVRRLYSFAGLIIALLASVAAVALSFIMSFLLFKLLNSWLPGLGFTESPGYTYTMSGWALAVAVALSVTCGFISSMIPYFVSRKRMAAEAARQAAGNQ